MWDIDSSTNIDDDDDDDLACSDEEGGNGSISKHVGVVTMSSTNLATAGIGKEDLFDNIEEDNDDDKAEGR